MKRYIYLSGLITIRHRFSGELSCSQTIVIDHQCKQKSPKCEYLLVTLYKDGRWIRKVSILCSLETYQRVTYIHVYKFRFQEQQTYLVNTTHMLFQLVVIWIVIYIQKTNAISLTFLLSFFKPLAQMDRHVGYICVQFWLMRKFILDISLYRFMVLLCSYTESKLSHFFFLEKVKSNVIIFLCS